MQPGVLAACRPYRHPLSQGLMCDNLCPQQNRGQGGLRPSTCCSTLRSRRAISLRCSSTSSSV